MLCAAIFIGLKDQIRKVCQEEYLVCGEGEEQGGAWMEKVSLHLFMHNLIMQHISFPTEMSRLKF
jgi:hypothetical protein